MEREEIADKWKAEWFKKERREKKVDIFIKCGIVLLATALIGVPLVSHHGWQTGLIGAGIFSLLGGSSVFLT